MLNTDTGKISPQFHVIFDDKFATVHSLPPDQPLAEQWADIFRLGRECFLDIDYDDNDNPILPPLTDIIKSYARTKTDQQVFLPTRPLDSNTSCSPAPNTFERDPWIDSPDILVEHPPHESFHDVPHPPITETEGAQNVDPEGVAERINAPTDNLGLFHDDGSPPALPPIRPRRNVGTYKDGPARIRKFPIDGESYDFTFNVDIVNDWEYPISSVKNKGRITTSYHPNKKISKSSIAECYLFQDTWFDNPTCLSTIANCFILDSWNDDGYYFNEISDPRLLAA